MVLVSNAVTKVSKRIQRADLIDSLLRLHGEMGEILTEQKKRRKRLWMLNKSRRSLGYFQYSKLTSRTFVLISPKALSINKCILI